MIMSTPSPEDWKLADLAGIRGVRFALVLSTDGVHRIQTDGIDRDEADRVVAACAGIRSLAKSLEEPLRVTGFQQSLYEWSDGFLFVRGAGDGSCLAVVTTAEIDPGVIGQAMAEQVLRVGESALSTPPRPPAADAGA
jgi:predicted regulator of Ras-like GTPase activity (Roadblock/LC7/MglB family)